MITHHIFNDTNTEESVNYFNHDLSTNLEDSKITSSKNVFSLLHKI